MSEDRQILFQSGKRQWTLEIKGGYSTVTVDISEAARKMPMDKLHELLSVLREIERERRGF